VEQFERLLVLKQLQLGVQNIDQLAEIQYSMSMYFIEWGMVARARELLMEALGTFRCSGGVRLAVSHEELGQLEELLGHYSGAMRELEAAGEVWKSLGSSRSTELVRNMHYRADLLEEIGHDQDAEKLRTKAQEVQEGKTVTPPRSAVTAAGVGFDKNRRKIL